MSFVRVQVSGPGTAKLLHLIEKARSLGAGMPNTRVMHAVGEKLEAKVLDCFMSATSPSGKPWAPPATDQKHPLLIKTGRLLKSVRNTSRRGAVVLEATVPYASYQNNGTRHIPARTFLPDRIPQSWAQEAEDVARKLIEEAMK